MHVSMWIPFCVCICDVWFFVHGLLWVAYGVSLRGVQPSLMKTDDREMKPLPVSTAMHTCVMFVCTIHVLGWAPSSPEMLRPAELFIPLTLCCLCGVCGLVGTRENITLNENLQPELHPTRATSHPKMQPTVQLPKGECVIMCNWLLQPLISAPTANGINTAISHCVLNTPCYLPCLTQVLSLPAFTPLCLSLVQAAQMPWHFGNVKQILARWHSETSAVFSLKGGGGWGP